jgi:hypothetical protein
MNKLYCAAVCAALAVSVSAPLVAQDKFETNFSYSYLGFNVGKVTLDEQLDFLGETYEEFGTFAVNASYQVHDNAAVIFGSAAMSNSGPQTEITASTAVLGFAFPFKAGSALDIVPTLGLLSYRDEFCVSNVCVKDDESGMAYGVSVRAWAIRDSLEINGSWADSTLEDSLAHYGIGGAFWWATHHSVRLNLGRNKESRSVSLGYWFTWR